MTPDQLIALSLFALVASITPGPNNLMLLTSGVNFGAKRSIPHILGISVGFFSLLFGVGAGLIELFDRVPITYTILKVFCVIYMFWLAWKIANASAPEQGDENSKPISFIEASMFQWVNPKAWAMAITCYSVYAPNLNIWTVFIMAFTFVMVNFPSIAVWLILGTNFRRLLSTERTLRSFNIVMALLLIASLYPILDSSI